MPTAQITANANLDASYGSGSPATIYAALATAKPDPTGNTGKGTMVEPTTAQYSGYARVAITNDVTHWAAAAAGAKTNALTFTFPASTGGASSPCIVTHLVFVTTNDNTYSIIDYLALPANTLVSSGGALSFPGSAATIQEA